MKLTLNEIKRQKTLRDRGLDFASADELFSGSFVTLEDTRNDYGEMRHISIGFIAGQMHIAAWTEREGTRRVISLRKANDREKARFQKLFDG